MTTGNHNLPEHKVDLVILGGGPAGLSTALHLQQLDPAWAERMIILEKAFHPRPKLCGGGVTRLGLNTLQSLGFNLPLPIPHVQVEDVRLVYGKRTIHVRGTPQIIIYNRPELDSFLAQAAIQRGIRLKQSEPALEIIIEPSGVIVKTGQALYHSKAVVGADGSNGLSRRLLARANSRTRIARLLEILQPGVETGKVFQERCACFDFTPMKSGLQGYCWDFPAYVDGMPFYNRGAYDARIAQHLAKPDLPRMFTSWLQNQEAALDTPLGGHPIHWFSPRGVLCRPRLLLVGDSAGVDALFGEGIAPALAYGRVAAGVLNQAFILQDFSFRGYRRSLLTSYLGRYLLIRWAVAWWAYRLGAHPLFTHTIWTLGSLLARLWPEPPPIGEAGRIGRV